MNCPREAWIPDKSVDLFHRLRIRVHALTIKEQSSSSTQTYFDWIESVSSTFRSNEFINYWNKIDNWIESKGSSKATESLEIEMRAISFYYQIYLRMPLTHWEIKSNMKMLS